MNLSSLASTPGSRHRPKRLGHGMGSGRGKTCGRGHKGQMARKGHKHKLGFEGGQMRLVRRIPKRGFKNPERRRYVPVSVGALARFAPGTAVDPDVLRRSRLATGARQGVKIVGQGQLGHALTVRAQAFSASARAKIEAAGGRCEVLD